MVAQRTGASKNIANIPRARMLERWILVFLKIMKRIKAEPRVLRKE
jgi:hypothetical protein